MNWDYAIFNWKICGNNSLTYICCKKVEKVSAWWDYNLSYVCEPCQAMIPDNDEFVAMSDEELKHLVNIQQ